MELTTGTWFGAFPLHDEEGRQLGEANTVPKWMLDAEVPHEWRPSRIPGCRRGRPFSLQALRQVTSTWQPLLADVSYLRTRMARSLGLERWGSGQLSPVRVTTLARVVTSVPAFLVRRVDGPLRDGELPARCAAAFKVMAGVHMGVEDLLEHAGDVARVRSPQELFDHIESRQLFLSPEGNACGGPVKMILELLRLVVEGEGVPRARPELATIVGDIPRLVRYGTACAEIELLLLHRGGLITEALSGHEDVLGQAAREEALARDTASTRRALAVAGVRLKPAPTRLPRWLAVHPMRESLARYLSAEAEVATALRERVDVVRGALGRPAIPTTGAMLHRRTPTLRRALRRAGVRLVLEPSGVTFGGAR